MIDALKEWVIFILGTWVGILIGLMLASNIMKSKFDKPKR